MKSDSPPVNSFMLSEGRGLKSLRILLSILLVPGLIVFALGALRRGDIRVWEIYLVNLLFWSGLSQAGVTVSALLHTTNGKWGKNITHIMEGMALFSPVALVLFLVLYIGDDTIFVWVREPVPEKAFLLDITHFFVRENFNLIVLNIFNLVFLYHSFRPDVGAMLEEGSLKGSRFFNWFTSGWRGFEAERERSDRALRWLSPVILFVYAVVYSMIAYDFVMSLDPYWYSTLFGAYYFMTNLYLGIAGIAIVVILVSRVLDLGGYVTEAHFRDIGLMLFVFCLIALDFFWSQYLVIWYGNIPEEITFLVNRIKEPQWLPVSLAVLAACFLLPFLLLLSRPAKKKPRYLLPIAILVFVGMWLERYLLVVPTLWHGSEVPLGFTEFAVTIAFMAAFVLVYIAFAKRFPLLPSDARARGTNGWGLENA